MKEASTEDLEKIVGRNATYDLLEYLKKLDNEQ